MDYKKILEEKYQEALTDTCCSPPNSKLEWIGDVVFDFTTYDGNMSAKFAGNMIDVIECILNGETFEYINKSEVHYITYLLMINMPFLKGKLEWGTSIRGAWFDEYGHHSEKEAGRIYYKKNIKLFCKDLLEWNKL